MSEKIANAIDNVNSKCLSKLAVAIATLGSVSQIEIHTDNLRTLIRRYGGQKPLADAVNKGLAPKDKPFSPSQISNALNGYRPFGDKLRRKIERALNLKRFAMEHPNLWLEGQAAALILSEKALIAAEMIDSLNEEQQKAVFTVLESYGGGSSEPETEEG